MKKHTTNLKLSQLNLQKSVQVRAGLDQETIDDYADKIKNGVKFPPISVVKTGPDFILADGYHRLEAANLAGHSTIEANIVTTSDKSKALEIALEGNRSHGLRMSNADKNRAVELALKQWPNESDNSIAERVGVSQPFVSKLRSQLITVINSTSRTGTDGKTYSMPPTRQTGWAKATKESIAAVIASGANGSEDFLNLWVLLWLFQSEESFVSRMKQLLDPTVFANWNQLMSEPWYQEWMFKEAA